MWDHTIIRQLIRDRYAYCYATGRSMEPIYGDGSLLRLRYIDDFNNVEPNTPVYFNSKHGFNRHLFTGYVDIPIGDDEGPIRMASICNGDGSFDQLIYPNQMIATVEVMTNTYIPREEANE